MNAGKHRERTREILISIAAVTESHHVPCVMFQYIQQKSQTGRWKIECSLKKNVIGLDRFIRITIKYKAFRKAHTLDNALLSYILLLSHSYMAYLNLKIFDFIFMI